MRLKLTDVYFGERMRTPTREAIKEMVEDLVENGQYQPILVRPVSEEDKAEPKYKGQSYAIVAGGTRFTAALTAGWDEIEAYVREDIDTPLRHRIAELHENLKRKQMTHDEEVKAKAEILRLRQIENPDITQIEVAYEIGDSPATFSRHVAAAKAIEKNPELAKAGSTKAVLRLSKLNNAVAARAAASDDDAKLLKKMNLQGRMVTADMAEWLRARPALSADLTIVDYPYGIDYWKQGHKLKKTHRGKQASISVYDDSPEYAWDLMTDTFPLLVRTTRETGWICCFGNFDSYLLLRDLASDCCSIHYDYRKERHGKRCRAAPEGEKCKFLIPEPYPWVWYRPNSQNNPRHPDLHAKSMHEYMMVVNMGAARLNFPSGRKTVDNVLVYDAVYGEDRIHANQKPVPLYQDLVERFTNLGGVVVDPCFGSGASLAAAASKSRFIYGCEKNPDILGPAIGFVSKYLVPMGNINEDASARLAMQLASRNRVTEEQLEDKTELDPRERPPADDRFHYVDEVGPGIINVRTAREVKRSFTSQSEQYKGMSHDELMGEAIDFAEERNEVEREYKRLADADEETEAVAAGDN